MRAAPLVVLPLVMSLALTAQARAECMAPAPAIFPLGDVVGPEAVLYRFAPRYTANQPLRIVDAAGKPVAFNELDETVPDTEIAVSRIVVSGGGGSFTVLDGEHAAPRTFHVARRGMDGPRPLVVEEVRWISEAWTCSHTEGLAISLRSPGVVAVRARWSDGFQALVPPSDRAFFHHGAMGGEIDPQALRVLLGHPNCVANVIPERYIARLDVALTAIYSDGTEQEIPLRREQAAPAPAPPPAPAPAPARWWIAGASAIGGLVTIALVLLVRRRRLIAVP